VPLLTTAVVADGLPLGAQTFSWGSCAIIGHIFHATRQKPTHLASPRFSPLLLGCYVILQLVELFGRVRDDWIEQDVSGWLAPNRIYPSVADSVAVSVAKDEVFIVTTKQVGGAGGCMMTMHMGSVHWRQRQLMGSRSTCGF
jgi:hypothetical protein